MIKPHQYIEVSNEDIKAISLGTLTAATGFFFQRFFKNRDSLNDRVRRLERNQAKMEVQFNKMEEYLHASVHDLKNMINEKSLKDNIVDNIYSTVSDIQRRMTNEKR